MPADLDPVAVLRRTDPASAWPVPAAPPLDELTAAARVDRPRRRARIVVLAAAVLLVVVLVGTAMVLVSGSDDPTPPVTEPSGPSWSGPALLDLAPGEAARPHLLALADRAEADPTPLPRGLVTYQRTATWTQLAEPGTAADEAEGESTQREMWTGADRRASWEDGAGPPARPGEVVQMDPDPPRPDDVETTSDQQAEGTPAGIPEDQASVEALLRLDVRPGPPPTDALLNRVADLLGDRPRRGPDRATVYRTLAAVDAIEYRGTVVDRAGRDGLAFSLTTEADGVRSEEVLVVDADGVVLGIEHVESESDAAARAAHPLLGLLRWYEVLLRTTSVQTVGERPT